MKSKALVLLSTIVMALALMAQSTTPTSPAPAGDTAKSCACCSHDQASGKMACCGKDSACAKDANCCKGDTCCKGKDGKTCPMASKNDSGKAGCCGQGKCPMMSKDKAGNSCCGGKMCERPQAGV